MSVMETAKPFIGNLKTLDRNSLVVQLSSEKIIKFAPRKLFVI